MTELSRLYSQRYGPSGGLAAVGVLNQLGRPDAEALETLIREAVQNCWDAKIRDRVKVHIGRLTLTGDRLTAALELLHDAPPGLPLATAVVDGASLLFVADEGTHGLRGPVRADQPGAYRDWVDLVLNVGQPPDKDLAGGSFGYGKAAFYLASAARTIIIDTLCRTESGATERRLIASGLGENYRDHLGRPHTGRHWWGDPTQDDPVPITGPAAAALAHRLGLPDRDGPDRLGTTIAVVAFDLQPGTPDPAGGTGGGPLGFIGESLVWNFWPRMIDTPGSVSRTLEFSLTDDGRRQRVPNPRLHPRLRDFTTAMDRLREEPGPDDDSLLVDHPITRKAPALVLGRAVLARGVDPGPVAKVDGMTVGARTTANGVHHVALMRTPEIVVRYFPGEPPSDARLGYAGVFRCEPGLDAAFCAAEPPAHDDWVPLAVPDPAQRSAVRVALTRLRDVCRSVAGYTTGTVAGGGDGIALGEFADTLATLLPGGTGPGARRTAVPSQTTRPRRRHSPAAPSGAPPVTDAWSSVTEPLNLPGNATDRTDESSRPHGATPAEGATNATTLAGEPDQTAAASGDQPTTPTEDASQDTQPPTARRPRRPELRIPDDPELRVGENDTPLISQAFDLRTHGQTSRVRARVEVMTTDGVKVEDEAPLGETAPSVHGWTAPDGTTYPEAELLAPAGADGRWRVEVRLTTPTMVRLDLTVQPA